MCPGCGWRTRFASMLEGELGAKWRPLDLARVESQLLYSLAGYPSLCLCLLICNMRILTTVDHWGLREN